MPLKNHDPDFTRRIFEQMPGYFFMKDRESNFMGCNAAFAKFAGEIVGVIGNFIIIPDEDPPAT